MSRNHTSSVRTTILTCMILVPAVPFILILFTGAVFSIRPREPVSAAAGGDGRRLVVESSGKVAGIFRKQTVSLAIECM